RADDVGGAGKGGYRQDARREQLEARGDGQAPGHQQDHPLATSQGVRATPRRPEQMGANFVALLLSTAVLQVPQADTVSPYSTPAVQQLVERTMARRRTSDSAVADYQ